MKAFLNGAILLTITALLLAGCQYISPLTEEHKIPIDEAALGMWQQIPDADKKIDPRDRMMIMKFSKTEYLIHISGLYFRGYLVDMGGIRCVQLQILGTWDGPVKSKEKNLFHVASYKMENGELTIKILNEKLINNMLDPEELRKTFLKHKDNEKLFVEPSRFRKVGNKAG